MSRKLNLDLSSLPTSITEARAQGSKHYFTGKPCKHGHVTYRWAAYGTCSGCSAMRHKDRYKNQPGFAENIRKRAKAWVTTNPDRSAANARKYFIKRNYGVEEAAIGILLLDQQCLCACCLEEFTKTPQLDHNHDTGKIRGLLCGPCNRVLGMVKDDTKILQQMITYLENNNG